MRVLLICLELSSLPIMRTFVYIAIVEGHGIREKHIVNRETI